MKTISLGTITADKPGRYEGVLPVAQLPDGSPVEIPVIVVRGASDGPVLWMHACVHGNEYCGTFCIHAFLRSLDPAQLKGAVIALPIVNLTAFRAYRRMSPFEGFNNGDLNRCFPGKADGGFTEQTAHAVFSELKRHATHFVDFHTAFTVDTRWALYADLGGEVSAVGRRMAEAFGYAHTLPTPAGTLAGSAMMAAAAEGVPCFLVEAGGMNDAFTRDIVDDVAERLRNLARAIGMLGGKVTDHGPLTTFTNFHWATAPRGGVFKPAVRCGDIIKEGDVIGTYFDLFGQKSGEARAPASGAVLALHPGPVIPQGDVLVHIGLNPKQA
jgi:predicted deacylase